jgi:integrase
LAAAAGVASQALYSMAIGARLRHGELFTLRWGDVDLES